MERQVKFLLGGVVEHGTTLVSALAMGAAARQAGVAEDAAGDGVAPSGDAGHSKEENFA